MKHRILLLFILGLTFSLSSLFAGSISKHRVIVLTDIEADPDDTQTLIRLLLYANQIDIEGIIACTSTHMKNEIHPESINKVIRGYQRVQPNLCLHEEGFPEAEQLYGVVKRGLPVYGMKGVGKGKNSEGSDWILKVLEQEDERLLWISAWGGTNTLAQVLYKIRETKTKEEASRLLAKLRIYTISDQDDSGIWIRKNFPELFYIVSPGGYGNATWMGMAQSVTGVDNEVVSNRWLSQNIQQGHGALGALYPDVGYGMEGDTPSWLSLIPNGLNEPEHPNWGAWGGRYEFFLPEYSTLDVNGFNGGVPIEPEPHAIWTNATDTYVPYVYNHYGRPVRRDTVSFSGNTVTIWRWQEEYQNDFAARMDWCIQPYGQANHPPVPALAHPSEIRVKSEEVFYLNADGTTDPDGDNLSYLWFYYPEAGTYKGNINFMAAENLYKVLLTAPKVDKEETAHFILKVTDKGEPCLSRYKRVIVHVLPE